MQENEEEDSLRIGTESRVVLGMGGSPGYIHDGEVTTDKTRSVYHH